MCSFQTPATLARMTGVAGVDPRLVKALTSFLRKWMANKSAKLTLNSVKGEHSVTLKLNLGYHGEQPDQNFQRTQIGPRQLLRRERRAADPGRKQQNMLLLLLLPPCRTFLTFLTFLTFFTFLTFLTFLKFLALFT